MPLIGNVIKLLAKSVLIPLGLTAAASATYAAIHKKMFGSGNTTLIISNEEMNDIMSLEESSLLVTGVSETLKNEAKEQKGGYLGMLLGTLGASLLGNLLTAKGTIRANEGTFRAGEGTVRSGFLMPPHPLKNFEIQMYYQNKSLMVIIQEIIYLK